MTTVHLNLKWSVADVDAVIVDARRRKTAAEICARLKGTRLESTVDEIMKICINSRFSVRRGLRKPTRRRA